MAQELVHDGVGRLGGDGEAYPLGGADNSRIDADNLSIEVNERPARVAGVNGGVGLQEVAQVDITIA